jgi:Cu-Zn family superoxide dismutase
MGIKAVFGLGGIGSGNCSFATAYNTQPAFAIAKVLSIGSSGVNSSGVNGTVIFQLTDNALSVSGVISGLTNNTEHGLHVHAFGDVRDIELGLSVGLHFMYEGQVHGYVSNPTRHTGDLGNIIANENGVAFFNILVPQDMAPDIALTLVATKGSAIGHAIVVHQNEDDGVNMVSSGARFGQGVIGYADSISSDAVLALMAASGSPFACGCTLTNETTGVTYNGFCEAKDCNQQTYTALILVVTIGPLSVLLVLALMKFQTWRTSKISPKKVGVVKWSSKGEQSLPLLSSA